MSARFSNAFPAIEIRNPFWITVCRAEKPHTPHPHPSAKIIGHDLEECVEQAGIYPEGGLIDDQLRKIVELLNPEYAGKRLEYHPGETFMVLPNEESMQNSVTNLIRSLRTSYTPACPPRRKVRC